MFRKREDGRHFVDELAEREPVLDEVSFVFTDEDARSFRVTTGGDVSWLHYRDGEGRWRRLRRLSLGEVMHAYIRATQGHETAGGIIAVGDLQ